MRGGKTHGNAVTQSQKPKGQGGLELPMCPLAHGMHEAGKALMKEDVLGVPMGVAAMDRATITIPATSALAARKQDLQNNSNSSPKSTSRNCAASAAESKASLVNESPARPTSASLERHASAIWIAMMETHEKCCEPSETTNVKGV